MIGWLPIQGSTGWSKTQKLCKGGSRRSQLYWPFTSTLAWEIISFKLSEMLAQASQFVTLHICSLVLVKGLLDSSDIAQDVNNLVFLGNAYPKRKMGFHLSFSSTPALLLHPNWLGNDDLSVAKSPVSAGASLIPSWFGQTTSLSQDWEHDLCGLANAGCANRLLWGQPGG